MTLLEKYRPRTLDNIFGHEDTVNLFKSYIEQNDIPHLLLHGKWGTGKTSIVESMLRDYYKKYYSMNVTIKNASQQSVRGIGAIDDIIENELGHVPAGEFPFKVMVFEEAEQITDAGQRSLKRAIEEYAHINRFIFITNYIEEMDEGIRSRCVQIEMNIPIKEKVSNLLVHIASKETENMTHEIHEEISNIVNLSLSPRESVKRLGVFLNGGKIENVTTILEKCVMIVSRLFSSKKDGIVDTKIYQGIMEIYASIRQDFPTPERDMLRCIHKELVDNYFTIHPRVVGEISLSLASTDISIQKSSNPNVHMSSLLWKLSKAFGKK
jgi:replication factor C small subunit